MWGEGKWSLSEPPNHDGVQPPRLPLEYGKPPVGDAGKAVAMCILGGVFGGGAMIVAGFLMFGLAGYGFQRPSKILLWPIVVFGVVLAACAAGTWWGLSSGRRRWVLIEMCLGAGA